MYIAPNSTIELFKGLKFDNSYANTMWFTDVNAQNTFFLNSMYRRLSDYSYQRKDIGVIRVEGDIATLFDVNYLRFKNTSFENKWFYAFVTRVEYINNAVCNLYYTIDVIQTYMFDWQLQQCLIERQHSTTDVAGDNLVPEGLELGDYISNLNSTLWLPLGYSVMISLGCSDVQYQQYSQLVTRSYRSYRMNGMYCGISYFIIDGVNATELLPFLDRLQSDNAIDSIASITMIPVEMGFTSDVPYSYDYSVSKVTALDGYTPVNKKLLTYPYCYLDVYNDQTEHQELRYELFSTSNCDFKLYCMVASTPEAIMYAKNYNKATINPDNSLSISGFPQMSYYNDSYKAWQALNYDQMAVSREIAAQQNVFNQQGIAIDQRQLGTQTALSGVSAIGGLVGSVLTGNVLGGVNSIMQGVGAVTNASYGAQRNDLASSRSEYDEYSVILRQSADESRAKKLANTPHAGSSSIAVCTNTKGFWYNKMSIREQYARRIDKYFTMFGYAQNIVGIPNIHARQYFTYIKTTGSCVSGAIPQDDRETIDTIFDRGIRFWTDYTKFEDYTVTNTILT